MSWVKRTHSKAATRGPKEVMDCGEGRAKLQLVSEAAADGLGDRQHNTEFQRGEIKLQTTD